MSGKEALSTSEIIDADLQDWRQLSGPIRARFRTGDFATGLDLVNRIGAAAEDADHHPDITLTYTDVIVTLTSHDVSAVTERDLSLARTISALAAEAGLSSDTASLTQVELGLDTDTGHRVSPFYAALLGSEATGNDLVDPTGQATTLWWQEPREGGTTLPDPAVPQRWHLDVWVGHDEAESRLRAVLAAGGRLVSDAAAPSFWVIEDPDGNRSCICAPTGR